MSSSNNSDFKRLAVEADKEREKELQSRKEAHLMKLEIDRQNNEDDSNERGVNSTNLTADISDSTFSSKYSSRTSSVETGAIDTKIRLLEEQNKEFKLAYIQLDEEKQILSYQLSLIRDQIEDLNESYRNIQKELAEKKKENSYQKFHVTDLTNRINFLKNEIDIRDKLIVDNNLVLINNSDFSTDSQINHDEELKNDLDTSERNVLGTALLSKDIVEQLRELAESSLECCIRTLFVERSKSLEEIKALKRKLLDENNESENLSRKESRKKHNGDDFDSLKQNYQNVKSQAQEYKRQLQLSQQKVTSLEADIKSWQNKVIRIEGQVKRYKSIADSCEKQEEELKQSKRKYQKEVREAQSKIEDLKSENATLNKKLEKIMKQKSKKENE